MTGLTGARVPIIQWTAEDEFDASYVLGKIGTIKDELTHPMSLMAIKQSTTEDEYDASYVLGGCSHLESTP